MRLFKLALSFLGILFIFLQSSQMLDREKKVRELMNSQEMIEALIIEIKCNNSKNKSVKFNLSGRKITKRIYVSKEECLELGDKRKIQLKIDEVGNIVFAKKDYNNSSENDSIAIILIAIFLIFVILKCSIIPTFTELRDGKI